MADPASTILIIEETPEVAEMLDDYFKVQDYNVVTVNWGEDGLNAAQVKPPDLVLLNVSLPDIDGFEVARRLRARRRTQNTPIIFLTHHSDRRARLRSLEMAAEDYVAIPFDFQELRLRVRNALRRTSRGSLTNPITGLPEGALVDERLGECLGTPGWGIVRLRLHFLESFRDLYGFVAADDVLRAVVATAQDSLRETACLDGFIGHLDAADLILVTDAEYSPPLEKTLRQRLAPAMQFFYHEKDRAAEAACGRMLYISARVFLPSRPMLSLEDLKNQILQSGE